MWWINPQIVVCSNWEKNQFCNNCRHLFCPYSQTIQFSVHLGFTNWDIKMDEEVVCHSLTFVLPGSTSTLNYFYPFIFRNGILLPKLFWPTVRKNCSIDWEKLLKFEAQGREFAKFLRSLEQFILTVNGQYNVW